MLSTENILFDSEYLARIQHLQSQLSLAQWLLPLLLFIIAVGFESMKHLVIEARPIEPAFFVELFFLGVLGPVTVALVLRWVSSQVHKREKAETTTRKLNIELEKIIEERTQKLEFAYQELADKNQELEELDRLKSEFVSLVSHELRAPLTNINGGLELILQFDTNLDPQFRDTLAILKQQSERLTRLVENILDISLIEAGKLPLRPGPVALIPVLRKVTFMMQAKTPHISVRMPQDTSLPLVWADEDYIAEVFVNLLDNAAKYSPDWAPITIGAQAQDEELMISVSDWGIGIPEEKLGHIFDRFYRLDTSDAKESYGYGLGLYMTKKLVEAQGGRIWTESTPGIGSSFFFTLPLARETPNGEELNGDTESFTDR